MKEFALYLHPILQLNALLNPLSDELFFFGGIMRFGCPDCVGAAIRCAHYSLLSVGELFLCCKAF